MHLINKSIYIFNAPLSLLFHVIPPPYKFTLINAMHFFLNCSINAYPHVNVHTHSTSMMNTFERLRWQILKLTKSPLAPNLSIGTSPSTEKIADLGKYKHMR
jgi:hypothetical protein